MLALNRSGVQPISSGVFGVTAHHIYGRGTEIQMERSRIANPMVSGSNPPAASF